MRRDDILHLTRANPFQPFRVVLSNGESYDIRHPDMILPTSGMATIACPSPDGPADAAEVSVHVSLFHILKVEYLAPPTAPVESNGAGA